MIFVTKLVVKYCSNVFFAQRATSVNSLFLESSSIAYTTVETGLLFKWMSIFDFSTQNLSENCVSSSWLEVADSDFGKSIA